MRVEPVAVDGLAAEELLRGGEGGVDVVGPVHFDGWVAAAEKICVYKMYILDYNLGVDILCCVIHHSIRGLRRGVLVMWIRMRTAFVIEPMG